MSHLLSFHPFRALPSISYPKCKNTALSINCMHKVLCSSNQSSENKTLKLSKNFEINSKWVMQQVGILALTVAEPALAVTGVNNEEDLIWVLLKSAAVAFGYFIIMPPIIMNWIRIRFYKRKLLERSLQFMLVFIFFPGVLLWAPFLNFRKFPRDPAMKYPWSVPENPVPIKGGGYLKYPWATIEDYEQS